MSIVGSDACSVFAGTTDAGAVLTALAEHLTVASAPQGWERVQANGPTGTVTVTRTMWTGPGSQASQIIRGAHNAVRNGTEVRPGSMDGVLTLVEDCEMILGVRFEPATGAEDPRVDAVHAVAAATRGLVFDGDAMLDAGGAPLVEV